MENKVRNMLDEAGLSGYTDDLMALATHSVRLQAHECEESALELGASKIGGVPDLPPHFEWPHWTPDDRDEPLSFIAQIRLADAARCDVQRLLPTTGMLHFFYDADRQPGICGPDDPTAHRVFYFDGNPEDLVRTPPPDDISEGGQFRPLSVSLLSEIDMPAADAATALGMSNTQLASYSRLTATISPRRSAYDEQPECHRMLGQPDWVQYDPFSYPPFADEPEEEGYGFLTQKDPDDWVLLLQVDSAEYYHQEYYGSGNGMMWGDVGRLFFLIRRSALLSRDFSNIMLIAQCG